MSTQPVLPKSMLNNLRESQPDRRTWTRQLEVLLNPQFEARPLNLPGDGAFESKHGSLKDGCDGTYVYYWARRGRGDRADTTRYMQLKAAGFTNATLEDITPLTATVNADGTEVTCGIDAVLMKVKPEIFYGARKFHEQRAINMTSPRTLEGRDMMMKSSDSADRRAMQETNSHFLNDTELENNATPEWKNIAAKEKRSK